MTEYLVIDCVAKRLKSFDSKTEAAKYIAELIEGEDYSERDFIALAVENYNNLIVEARNQTVVSLEGY